MALHFSWCSGAGVEGEKAQRPVMERYTVEPVQEFAATFEEVPCPFELPEGAVQRGRPPLGNEADHALCD